MTQLSHEWLSLPAIDLGPDLAATMRRILDGTLAPLRGPMTRAALEATARTGRLPGGAPWLGAVRLPVAGPGPVASPGDRLLLRDLEGAPIAVLAVEDAWRLDGTLHVGGTLTPARTDAAVRPPAAVCDAGPARPIVALPVHLAPTIAGLRAARETAGSTGEVLFLVADAPDRLDGPPAVALLAAIEASGQAAGRHRLVRVPLRLPSEPAARHLWMARLARAHGATALVTDLSAEAALPDGTPMTVALQEIGLRAIAGPHDPPDLIERLRSDAPLPADLIDAAVAHAVRAALRAPRHRGLTIFFTGLSGSGKSTIATRLADALRDAGRVVTLLDGDLVRRHLSSELGFSREHRDLNIRRIAFVAAEIGRHGGLAICAPIAPYAATRQAARGMVEAAGARFVLVHVSTPLAVCEARDRKGLYARARAGEIAEFTGISDPYEVPTDADLAIDASTTTLEDAVAAILQRVAAG